MCKVSPRLKLCACDARNASGLANYWVLHRFNAKKQYRIIGRVAVPDAIDAQAEAYNQATLQRRLNEPDAFDVELNATIGDRLQLTFRFSEPGASGKARGPKVTYGYALTTEGWVREDFDPLSWQWHHDRSNTGELRPALGDEGKRSRRR